MFEEFYINGNNELKTTISEQFYDALDISSLYKDIDEATQELENINFNYETEKEILINKYIVFFHSENGGGRIGAKHKYIIKPTDLYCGANGHEGALRLKFDIVQSEYVGMPEEEEYIAETKRQIDLGCVEDGDVDCRKLFHYVTYFFSPRYFQGTKVFDTLEAAEEYYNKIQRYMTED